MSTTKELIKTLRDNISTKLNRGETGVAKDLRELHDLEKLLEKDTPPEIREGEPIRVKRSYTMTEAARAQRMAASARSTGPTSPEGKAICSKNNWKHGKYAQSRILGMGKPCRSTCTDYPCSLVEEGKCQPGSDCLDKEHLLEACLAIERALKEQDYGDFNSLMVMEMGESLQVIRELRGAILEHGTVVETARVDKNGTVIGYDLKPHPALLALPNLMKNMGISFTDFMMTPAAQERKKTDDSAITTIADIFKSAGNALAQAKAVTPLNPPLTKGGSKE
jgi:hypothetical protein